MLRKLFLFAFISLCFACGQSPENQLENKINERMSRDLTAIGTMAAKYEAVFAHYEYQAIGFNDIYLQKAIYSIIYGFDVQDAKINVGKEKDGTLVLNVKLPSPHEIKEARDRITLNIEKRFEDYYPKDDNGNKINVSRALDNTVQRQVNKYQRQHIHQARKMTKQYFQALADNYGMKLNYSMDK
jgi:hypothetical protein